MSSLICIDASLALKLVLGEADSPRAITLWQQWIENDTVLVAPPLLAYEVTSVLRTKVSRGLLNPADGDAAFAAIHAQGILYQTPEMLHVRAWELAKQFNQPAAYDAHYLALAEILGCPLWTADERLYATVKTEFPWIHWLLE